MGVDVMQTKNEVFLEQSAYTKALLSRFGMDKANSVATPLDVNADLVTTSDEVEEYDKNLYQSAVVDLPHPGNLQQVITIKSETPDDELDEITVKKEPIDWDQEPQVQQLVVYLPIGRFHSPSIIHIIPTLDSKVSGLFPVLTDCSL
ncbi:hypothetical protein FHG87_013812 [Trinorchestia longiramus]|nr:hypothetical protein FHG87_013812 [Trinorchestia longiramus]